ncbi:MAG: hypothetical protein C4291_01975 [Candidatus Dadabacteria bacterium]
MVDNKNKALKEWTITIKALDEGRQIILLRKGGIREENREFRVENERFLLYPTYEHQREDLIKEEFRGDFKTIQRIDNNKVTIRNWAIVSDTYQITELERLEAIFPYHIWTANYAMERLTWRPRKPLHVIFLRVFRLPEPKTIDILPEYGGCRSWISLSDEFSFDRTNPVLNEEEFKYISEKIKNLLR